MTIENEKPEDFVLHKEDAVLVVSPDGELRLRFPHMEDADVAPVYVAEVAACAVALKTPALMDLLWKSVYGDDDDED